MIGHLRFQGALQHPLDRAGQQALRPSQLHAVSSGLFNQGTSARTHVSRQVGLHQTQAGSRSVSTMALRSAGRHQYEGQAGSVEDLEGHATGVQVLEPT